MNRTSLSLRANRCARSGDPLPCTLPQPPTGALFFRLRRYYGIVGHPTNVYHGITTWRSPHDPPHHQDRRVITGPPGSCGQCFRTCTGSSTLRGPPAACDKRRRRCCLPPCRTTSAPRARRFSSPACTYPYRRFAAALTDDSARLRATVARHAFDVGLSHSFFRTGSSPAPQTRPWTLRAECHLR